MAAVSIPQSIDEINERLKGKAEAGARTAMAAILAACKCSTVPKVSTGKLDGKTVRFYDYGKVKAFDDHIIMAVGPGYDPVVILGSDIAKSGPGVYIATTPDAKAQADAEAVAKKASEKVAAPPPKKAITPGAKAAPARRAAASRAAKEEAKAAPWNERAASLRPSRSRSYGASSRSHGVGEGEWESPGQTSAREHEERMSKFREARAAGRSQYEAKKMATFRDLRAKGREAYEAKKAAARPVVDQEKAAAQAQTLIAALRAMKKGK